MNPGTPLTEEDRKILESTIEATYKVFLNRVASGRKLPLEQVSELAQGRVYTGMEARELGLVDDLGGYQSAVRQAKILSGLDPERLYPLHRYGEDEMDLRSCLANPLKCLGAVNTSVSLLDLAHSLDDTLRGTGLQMSRHPWKSFREERLAQWIMRYQREPLALWTLGLSVN